MNMRTTARCITGVLIVVSLACGGRRESVQPQAKTAAPSTKKNAPATAPATATAQPAGAAMSIGSVMPAYSAQTLDGKPYDLASERGQVVLVNLWATWCAPCRYEIPELQKVHDKFAARGFKVLGVSLDDSGADTVKQFVAEHKMTYPIVIDPEGKLANMLQTSSIPATMILDRKGKILWKELGPVTEAEVAPVIEAALKGAS